LSLKVFYYVVTFNLE